MKKTTRRELITMMNNIYTFLFYAIPVCILAFFAVSLYRYISACAKNKRNPETYTSREIKNRLTLLVLSSVIAGVLVMVVIGVVLLMFMAVAYM